MLSSHKINKGLYRDTNTMAIIILRYINVSNQSLYILKRIYHVLHVNWISIIRKRRKARQREEEKERFTKRLLDNILLKFEEFI